MKYLTLGLAAAILSFSAVYASPTDPHADAAEYFDHNYQVEERAAPLPAGGAGGTPGTNGTNGTNGTEETAAEKAEDEKWKAFDQALDQNECARNSPHSWDQKRLSKECTDRFKGKLQTVKVDNPTPITFIPMPTDKPDKGKLPPKPSPSTIPVGKASLYVCNCASTKMPPMPTGL